LRYHVRRVSSSFCLLLNAAGQTNTAAAMYNDGPARRAVLQRVCKAHIFDYTFDVNRAFNAELFVAPPHAIAMEFDLFGERWSSHL
jgi:hypothetical protein